MIKRYNARYSVSSDGSVYKGKETDEFLVPITPKIIKGYYGISLLRVHIMVAELFIGERPKGHHVHHINHNKLDNRVENLSYVFASNHIIHHQTGNTMPEHVKTILSEFNSRPKTDEHKKHLSEAKRGIKQSPELIEKRVAPLRGKNRKTPWLNGVKKSAESHEARRVASIKRCRIHDVEYESVKDASLALGIKHGTLVMRFHRNTPNYEYI